MTIATAAGVTLVGNMVVNGGSATFRVRRLNSSTVSVTRLETVASVVNDLQLAKAWVNFNGTGTVAIRSAFNVSSITDNGTGNYSINFTNNMPDADYPFFGNAGASVVDNGANGYLSPYSSATKTVSSVRTLNRNAANSANVDGTEVAIIVFSS